MGGIFSHKSSKPKSRVTQQDEAVLQLKCQRDKLKQYQRRIEGNVERERNVAKQLLKANKKDRALLLLKKKRYQEQLLDQTIRQLDNIDQMIHDVEFAQIQNQIVEGLKIGNDCLHRMHAMFSVEDVEKIMDETREAVEYQREIDALISGQFNEQDLSEVEHEFDELMKESEIPKLPEVPEEELPTGTKIKEKDSRRKVALEA